MIYDVIIIGGGTAGLAAYKKVKSQGKKVLIVEAKDFVTTCADVGCMPSKLLIAAANANYDAENLKNFGINLSSKKINDKLLLDRVRLERDRFVSFVKKGTEEIPQKDKVFGYATFISIHEIEVNGKVFTSKTFIIATGSRPFYPKIFKEIKKEVLTNENIFELKKLPKTIAVFGAGVIGLEMSYALSNLGVKVTLFNKGNNILKLHKDLNNEVLDDINKKMDFISDKEVSNIIKKNNAYILSYGNEILEVEKILVATGRVPNIDNLGLERFIGNEILKSYSYETTQLGKLPIFLAGDVNGHLPLLHEAAQEGLIAAENAIRYPKVRKNKRSTFLSITFTYPEIIQVGRVLDLPDKYIKGTVSFEDQGRSRIILKNKGMLNLFFDKKEQLLLGAEMFGPSAEHIAHSLVWLIEKRTTLDEMLIFPYYHPVIEESIRTAVRDAAKKF